MPVQLPGTISTAISHSGLTSTEYRDPAVLGIVAVSNTALQTWILTDAGGATGPATAAIDQFRPSLQQTIDGVTRRLEAAGLAGC